MNFKREVMESPQPRSIDTTQSCLASLRNTARGRVCPGPVVGGMAVLEAGTPAWVWSPCVESCWCARRDWVKQQQQLPAGGGVAVERGGEDAQERQLTALVISRISSAHDHQSVMVAVARHNKATSQHQCSTTATTTRTGWSLGLAAAAVFDFWPFSSCCEVADATTGAASAAICRFEKPVVAKDRLPCVCCAVVDVECCWQSHYALIPLVVLVLLHTSGACPDCFLRYCEQSLGGVVTGGRVVDVHVADKHPPMRIHRSTCLFDFYQFLFIE